MSVQIQMRRGTAAQWATANTLLAEGEIGLELDTQKFKMGTGLLAWNDLLYYSAVGVSSVNGQTGTVVLDTDDVAEGAINKYLTATEQSKLDGIEAGAEVNVNADWTAVSGDSQILNKPTLGTAASTASTDYATAAQGALADSALQPAAIANMLETADIGVTVQGYSANTVVDASYVHTDNNYTTTEKSKLAGIPDGTLIATLSGAETLTNKTLTDPIISNYTETVYTANTGTAITINLVNGTVQNLTLTGSPVITMPTATAGKSFIMYLKTGTGGFTITWTTVKWSAGTAPTITSTASKMDIYSFFSDGTNWYGTTVGQNYTP